MQPVCAKLTACLISLLFIVIIFVSPVWSCFGPKLFFGVGDSVEDQVFFALISLYVQEKTGVESTLVKIGKGQPPLKLIDEDKADLVLAPPATSADRVVFSVDGYSVLASGQRPREDLQFTTVLPAVEKLNRLITADDVLALIARVDAGESAFAAVRSFFMERRWI